MQNKNQLVTKKWHCCWRYWVRCRRFLYHKYCVPSIWKKNWNPNELYFLSPSLNTSISPTWLFNNTHTWCHMSSATPVDILLWKKFKYNHSVRVREYQLVDIPLVRANHLGINCGSYPLWYRNLSVSSPRLLSIFFTVEGMLVCLIMSNHYFFSTLLIQPASGSV